jgi:hypothetical protein
VEIVVDYAGPKEWKNLSEKAHLIAFSETKPSEWDRIDFALLVRRGEQAMGYVTCREHDHETLYWQYGGAFPGTKESSLTFAGYKAFVSWSQKKYKRITTLIENNNVVMLKMAMKVGFRIVGVRLFRGHVLLEHLLEFPDAV